MNRNFTHTFRSFLGIASGTTLMGVMLIVMSGCQVDVSGGLGAKALYPNGLGKFTIGDPRGAMYGGSGYGEGHTAGSQSGTPGFQGMRGGE